MFSPGLEKSCVRPESCSPVRNASTRFPTGVSLGDENQQISRIQLAVQKYNNSSSIPVNNKSGFLSPVRHCLLKNTLRSKNYETEEGLTKNEKKSGNYYEGVGAFPTIHLRKSAIRYRPIRRFHDVKVPYPELPVNRYLSHLPELCTDLKSSTRSVLDVLQDLSAKKIEDEDEGNNKTKSKGLAGDCNMNPNTVYKPLFIQKPKMNAITTRDSMTQTSSPFRADTPSPQQICNLNSRNDVSDPKAELRKKLAKQNNEISASLSSSITASFAIKRKLDKVITSKDDDRSPDMSIVKKSRIDRTNQTENGFSKSTSNKKEPAKLNRKLKFIEASSPPSSKDRLTTIFLDIRSTSPKRKVFKDSDSPKSNVINNGFALNPPATNGSVEAAKTPEVRAEEPSKTDSGKHESEQSKPVFGFPVDKLDNNSTKPSTPTCEFGLPSTNFNFKPTGSSSTLSKDSSDGSKTSVNHADDEKKGQKTFVKFGSNETNFSSDLGFKFTDTAKSPVEQKMESLVVTTTAAPVTIATPQFTFGVKSSETIPPGSRPSTQSTFIISGQPLFVFGQNGSSSAEVSTAATSTITVSAPSISQNIQPGMFTFGQKPSVESSLTQASVVPSTPSITQAPSASSSVALNSTVRSDGLTSIGQKVDTVSTTTPETSTTEQKPHFTFTFGQKNELQKAPEFGQKNLFTFGQKSTPETIQTSNQTPANPATFGQTTVAQPAVSLGVTTFSGFGTPASNSSSSPSTVQQTFGVSVKQDPLLGTTGQSTPALGAATTSTIAFGVSTTTTSTFGTSTATTPVFGAPATTTSTFGTSTATTPVFGAPATTTSTFGTSTATTPVFGASATTASTFGTSTATTPVFGASATTASTFGTSTATTPAFKASTTTTSTFGTSTVTTPVFGASGTTASTFGTSTATTPVFGASGTTASTFGTSTATTPVFGASGTTASTFGTSTATTHAFGTSTTTTSAFGASSTQPTFKFGPSTTQATNFGVASSHDVPTTITTQSPAFGLNPSQPTLTFGTSTSAQPTQIFGTSATQSTPAFGVSSGPAFSVNTTSASVPAFGTTTSASTSIFGSSSSALTIPSFGTPATQNSFGTPTTQTTPAFGVSTSQSVSSFGTSTMPAFGASSTVQSTSSFGSSTASSPAFGGVVSSSFGASPQPNSIFGAPASTQSGFGATTNASVFGTSGGFGTSSSQSSTGFGTSGGTQTTSAFGTQPFGKPLAPNIFGQSTSPTFSSASNFAPTQNNIFGTKSGENKMFGAQNNFQFGSTANSTTSPPTAAAAPVFSFGGGSGGVTNTFSFTANSSAGSSNTQTPFAFTPNEPFKFGATPNKENTGFGVGASPNFNFGSQMSSTAPNPAFDFRPAQNNAASGFNFPAGSSVFSFGGSSSSSSSNKGFNFGTPTPGATPTFGVPGTFSIGSGSSQSRPRAASRLRRRP